MYTFEEHTSEVQVRLESASLALAELMGGEAARAVSGDPETVRLGARDRNALLVEWLNELIYRSGSAGKAYVDFRIDHVSDRELAASIRGQDVPEPRLEVKAATFHGLDITQTAGGFAANVVLDV